MARPTRIAERSRADVHGLCAKICRAERPESALQHTPPPTDLVITYCEVCDAHGTGALLRRLFPDRSSTLSLRTHNVFDSTEPFGAVNVCFPFARACAAQLVSGLRLYFRDTVLERVLCVPLQPEEAILASGVSKALGLPLCTYIMDDRNVGCAELADDVVDDLLRQSDLRLVIGPEMKRAYENKYRMDFWVLPPVVTDVLIRDEHGPAFDEATLRRGVLLGNVWSQRWLELLRTTLSQTPYEIDWYCGNSARLAIDADELAGELRKDGIRLMDPVAETELPELLSGYGYAIMPSDPLDGRSPAVFEAMARYSVPCRIPTIMATAQLPVLVLGSPETAAARFVCRFQVGACAAYDPSNIAMAVQSLLEHETRTGIQVRSTSVAGSFSAAGAADWIWRSLAAGAPCDSRYERLFASEE